MSVSEPNRFSDADTSPAPPWLSALRLYLLVSLTLHLAWEILHLPLYTLWRTSTWRELAFAIAHCTLGDGLIALATLAIGVIVAGRAEWPRRGMAVVATVTIALGIAYTAYSEYHNVYVRRAWAYADAMPVVVVLGWRIGISPLLQWLAVPGAAFWIMARRFRHRPLTPTDAATP
ncbi:MAG: hypothetical protein M5U07_26280 [Xanthobacteraceae bacterium]|nr:hypothetical protein [Xanthobacteraceae bacterium]PWB58201.1 MAG: hypothetical protein C3F17_19120 [Bradyrhizobiaceae bacterium]